MAEPHLEKRCCRFFARRARYILDGLQPRDVRITWHSDCSVELQPRDYW